MREGACSAKGQARRTTCATWPESLSAPVWMSIEDSYELPTKRVEDGTMISKPRVEWTAIDFDNAKWHHRAVNAIFGGVDSTQFIYI